MPTARLLIGWPLVLVIAACIGVLAWDARTLADVDAYDFWWMVTYTISAVHLILWRRTLERRALVTFGAFFYGATLSRIGLFISEFVQDGDRLSGLALNVLLLVLVWRFVKVQSECSTK